MTPEGARLDRFLGGAIADLKQDGRMSAGLRRLTNLTESLTKRMDARAGELADRLEKAETEGEAALGKFEAYVGNVEAGVRQAQDTINQLTNGAPPLPDLSSSSATLPPEPAQQG